uniref:Uncharacterized protein n=1 Tax=Romanomermis culicivorax TaxID=13658 RepID=A0A915IHK4_ROMCU
MLDDKKEENERETKDESVKTYINEKISNRHRKEKKKEIHKYKKTISLMTSPQILIKRPTTLSFVKNGHPAF